MPIGGQNMNYPRIMAEICHNQWAILPDALNGILRAIESGLSSEDRTLFHGASEAEFEAVVANMGDRVEGSQYSSVVGNVGILRIDGPIVPKSSFFSQASGLTSIDVLAKEFQAFERDEDINSILLFMDTPGGAVKGISEFAALVAGCRKQVYAFVFGMAASAGYWIASAADKIVGSNTSIVGSIGVVATIDSRKDKNSVEIVSAQSPKKRLDITSEEGRSEMQTLVDDQADIFINAVAANRNVSIETVLEDFGQGGVMIASKALHAGMIDNVATLKQLLIVMESGDVSSEILPIEPRPVLPMPAVANENNTTPPAVAGLTTGGVMDLKSLMAENPEAASELEALKKEQFEAGRQAGVGEVEARVNAASPFLTAEGYPSQIKELAAKVVAGKLDAGALEAAVSVYDAVTANEKNTEAAVEGETIPETPPQKQEALSEDGLIRTEADFKAQINAARAAVYGEVS